MTPFFASVLGALGLGYLFVIGYVLVRVMFALEAIEDTLKLKGPR